MAVRGGEVVGHVLFSPVTIDREGSRGEAIGLAPMAVLPEYQRGGIGSLLVREALDRLRALGTAPGIVRYRPEFADV